MTWLLGVLGVSGLAAVGLGLLAWFSGGSAVLAVLRGLWAFAMKLLRYFGDGLFGIAKRPVEMFACGCLCIAAMVLGIWIGLAWTKHVREQARGTVANIESAHEREDDADKALAAAAVQARAAAEAAERKRQDDLEQARAVAELAASPDASDGVALTDRNVTPDSVQPEPKAAPRKARRVRQQEAGVWPSFQADWQAVFGK